MDRLTNDALDFCKDACANGRRQNCGLHKEGMLCGDAENYNKLREYERSEECGELVRVVTCGSCEHGKPDEDAIYCDEHRRRFSKYYYCADGIRGSITE